MYTYKHEWNHNNVEFSASKVNKNPILVHLKLSSTFDEMNIS